MISILIVDDDLNKISNIIGCIHTSNFYQIDIKQASDAQGAIELMQKYHFHLLITDLLMPLRKDEAAVENGGFVLVRQIYKEREIKIPLYIIALTQYKTLTLNFNHIWMVWEYNPSLDKWRNNLKDIITHIDRVNYKIIRDKKPTLFVEGETDKVILEYSLKLFYPKFIDKINIDAIKRGGGASWVGRQLIIWGKTLFRQMNGEYLQAVGLFDNDSAGIEEIKSLNNSIVSDSAERQTFSLQKLEVKHAAHLLPIYQKGLIIPIRLEELYSPICWKYADEKGWLVNKSLIDELVNKPKKWDPNNQSFKDYLTTLNLSSDLSLYLNKKVGDDYKTQLTKYILSLEREKATEILQSVNYLLSDIFVKLKIEIN